MGEVRVRLQPRARREEIAGVREGALLVRVTAPPVDGRANAALCKLLARTLGVPPRDVAVLRGHGARDKVVEVDGVETSILRSRLGITP